MSQPLVASFRLAFHYVVDGRAHVMRLYCDAIASGTDPGGFAVDAPALASARDISDVVDDVWTALNGMFLAASTTKGEILLEEFVGSVWVLRATYTSTVSLDGTGTLYKASQVTITLRDTAFKKIRNVTLDTRLQAGFKDVSGSPGSVPLSQAGAWIDYLIVSGGVVGPITGFDWVRSRGDRAINAFPYVSAVTDLNDKVRRRAGTA